MRFKVLAAFALSLLSAATGCVADVPKDGIKSPEGDKRFTAAEGAKPLNNMVFELLNVKGPGFTGHVFRNPREGFVYIRIPKPAGAKDRIPKIALDDKEITLKAYGDGLETMRYLSEGSHTVAILPGAGRVESLEVRAIGELVYAALGDNPHIPELGNYTWEYLRENCLDHFNSLIADHAMNADGTYSREAELKEWTDEGKRWFTLHPVPDHIRTNDPTQSADHAYTYWTSLLGMNHPLMSGIWADEFGPGRYQTKYYPYWTDAIRRIGADPKFAGRKFNAYFPNRLWPLEDEYETMYPFINALLASGYRMGPEWYLTEGRSRPGRIIEKTDDLRAEFGPEWEMASRESYERAARGAAKDRIVIVGILSEPGQENSDLFADCNFNVFLDYQMYFIATEPAFFGVRGVQGYLSSYCAEEQLRLFAKLVRHYFIEGRTDRYLSDPYVLTHLKNPDFVEGTEGWNLSPAVAGEQPSIAARNVKGFGTIQGKYHAPADAGDAAVWTKRSAQKPNVISQKMKDLVPGKLYSLHFITGDYQEFMSGKSEKRKHAVSAKIEGVELIPDKCFQAIINGGYWYGYGAFNRENLYWMNYHQQVFRATGKTANLVLSDWASESSAEGPEGEEILWNFVQLQPYVE